MPATPSPSADGEERSGVPDLLRPFRRTVPRTLQWRLTGAFVGIVALTIALVAPVVINRLDDYYRNQEVQIVTARRNAVASAIVGALGNEPVLTRAADGTFVLTSRVRERLMDNNFLNEIANNVAQADVSVTFGPLRRGVDAAGLEVVNTGDPNFTLTAVTTDGPPPGSGLARDPAIVIEPHSYPRAFGAIPWGMTVALSNPFTTRASTLGAVAGLLFAVAVIACVFAVMLAAIFARRVTTPIRRLSDAAHQLAEGDLSARIPEDATASATIELAALARQFNAMATRLQQSVSTIRRDRDRSREFLADVSHELRTPIAALRTFTELLQGDAGSDPAARAEFLESSATQLERLDWLAQNLLDLSKLDSGLVLLDLRPDDVRGTVESAVEQAEPAARRRGIALGLRLPDTPIRIWHDPPRVGQILSNLIGNALKFTERGGSVRVALAPEPGGGARIEVVDTGVGIDPDELPRIFERFYRGSRANEARSTGSGLGLAIVQSIVEMHHGTIEVESRVGGGSRFVVTLPRDPREIDVPATEAEPAGAEQSDVRGARETIGSQAAEAYVVDSSPVEVSRLNRDTAR
ncbi:MAG: ATP-binding protein [Chloroflexota bacterium]